MREAKELNAKWVNALISIEINVACNGGHLRANDKQALAKVS
ncbi:MAG: hypothetical protein ACEY26_00535 [Candidatus Hodgkinia cicadicola]